MFSFMNEIFVAAVPQPPLYMRQSRMKTCLQLFRKNKDRTKLHFDLTPMYNVFLIDIVHDKVSQKFLARFEYKSKRYHVSTTL